MGKATKGRGPLTVIAYPITRANTLSGLPVPSSETAAHLAHLARCAAARWPPQAHLGAGLASPHPGR